MTLFVEDRAGALGFAWSTTVWIDTTDFDTFAETPAQFGASPPSTGADPEPWLFDDRLLSELDVGFSPSRW